MLRVANFSTVTIPYVAPDDAGRLNDKERDAIRAVVRALFDAKDVQDGSEVGAGFVNG